MKIASETESIFADSEYLDFLHNIYSLFTRSLQIMRVFLLS